MAAIKCPHCGEYTSSTLEHCTECKKSLNEPPQPKRMTGKQYARLYVSIFTLLLLVSGAVWLYYSQQQRAQQLEYEAYLRLDSCTDLRDFEDFLMRYPRHDSIQQVRQRYEQLKEEENLALQQAVEEAEAKARELRLQMTPEETSILQMSVNNFLVAMTARDSVRIDELLADTFNFCGMSCSKGANVVAYYNQELHKEDVLGIHFQLGEVTTSKNEVPESTALSYSLQTDALATINRSSLDSAMTTRYHIKATFSPEKQLTSMTLLP